MVSVMLYPCMLCIALIMDMLVLCVACLTVFHQTIHNIMSVVVILLMNVMKVLSVGGGALLDTYTVFQIMCMLCL